MSHHISIEANFIQVQCLVHIPWYPHYCLVWSLFIDCSATFKKVPWSTLYQAVPGPCRVGSFENMKSALRNQRPLGFFWDAETMKCWSCEAHQRMNRWWLRCQWHDLTWQNPCTADWLNEQTNQWINKSMNERTNERMNERMNGWMDEWVNEQTNDRTNERMNEWTNC